MNPHASGLWSSACPTERLIFLGSEYAWFLPLGLAERCLLTAPWRCGYSNTINTPVFMPGDYFLVIWNPSGQPCDNTANFGFQDDLFKGDADIEGEIAARERDAAVTHQAAS